MKVIEERKKIILTKVWGFIAGQTLQEPVAKQSPDGRAYLIVTNEKVRSVTLDAGPVTVTPYAEGSPITGKMITAHADGLKEAVIGALSVPGVDAVHFYSKKGVATYKL